MFITTEDYKKVSSLTFSDSIKDCKNNEQIEKSEKCGCFSCCEIFTPSEITDYLPDEPSLQFEEGIEETVKWYLDNQEWMANVTSGDYQKYYENMYKDR